MIKVLVLEGSLRLSVNGTIDRSVLLLPGKMVTMPPDAKEIPAPVSFNLAQVMKASPLVTMDGAHPLAGSRPNFNGVAQTTPQTILGDL